MARILYTCSIEGGFSAFIWVRTAETRPMLELGAHRQSLVDPFILPRISHTAQLFFVIGVLRKSVGKMKGQRDRVLLQRWRLMSWALSSGSYHVKILIGMALLFSTFLLIRRTSSIMGWHHHCVEPSSQSKRQGYTVLINTWKRNDLLKKSVAHYASCSNTDAIRVVWSEMDAPSSNLHSALLNSIVDKSRRNMHVPEFHIDMNDEDDLNNRFRPISGLKTKAIFSVDDDVIIPCKTLEFAYSVWESAQDSMVGFVPRMHWAHPKKHMPNRSSYTYGGWWSVWWTGTYSMVLTKAAFLHSKYLEMYTNQMPASVREYVKTQRNCEDIAMSFLVANVTGASPLWVKARIHEIGSSGISSLTGHSHRRTNCVNYLTSIFGYMPLISTSVKVVDAHHQWVW